MSTSQSCYERLCKTLKSAWHLVNNHSWLAPLLDLPPHTSQCSVLLKDPDKHQRRELRREIPGENSLRDFKREGTCSLYQVYFVHEEDSSMEFASNFRCIGLGPGNEMEAVDNSPSLDLWCFF